MGARLNPINLCLYDSAMHIGRRIQAWRISRNQSVESLSDMTGISADRLAQIESKQADPSAATIQALATVFRIPPAWLFDSPESFDYLFQGSEDAEEPAASCVDPVTDRILTGSYGDRSLYVLLTALMQAGDPKLLRAAEVSLRSLVKQSRQTLVPWQQRPSGHFEPPSD
jgi:transcriptional regulator with XRE-family HTH domain